MTQAGYGIPDIRDAEGNLRGVDHTTDWHGTPVTINHVPLTVAELQKIEHQGADVDVEFIRDLLDEHIKKPEVEGDYSAAEALCFFEAMCDFAGGGDDQLMRQAREELERRAGEDAAGN